MVYGKELSEVNEIVRVYNIIIIAACVYTVYTHSGTWVERAHNSDEPKANISVTAEKRKNTIQMLATPPLTTATPPPGLNCNYRITTAHTTTEYDLQAVFRSTPKTTTITLRKKYAQTCVCI